MAAPQKPWERAGQNNRESSPSCCNVSDVGVPRYQPMERGIDQMERISPALPSRNGPLNSSYMSSYNRFNGSYGGFNSYGYSSPYSSNFGSMYSPYGYGSSLYGNRFGTGYNNYGGQEGYSQFLRQAEENSRPAFQSIESIVQAFASVSMMLESTFQTVHNCFRAVLGVADHFSRLKVNMARILSALAIFRFLRYMYRRLLELLRLREPGFAEEVWKEAERNAVDVFGVSSNGGRKPAPSWPIFMFFAVVVGGPYMIWKLLCSVEGATEDIPEWASGEEDHVVARAEYDFDSDRVDEISFRAGDLLNLAPKELQPNIRGWLLASVDGTRVGLVPGNYVKVQGKRRGRQYTKPQSEREIVSSVNSLPPIKEEGRHEMEETCHEASSTPTVSEWKSSTNTEQNELSAFDKAYDGGPTPSK